MRETGREGERQGVRYRRNRMKGERERERERDRVYESERGCMREIYLKIYIFQIIQ